MFFEKIHAEHTVKRNVLPLEVNYHGINLFHPVGETPLMNFEVVGKLDDFPDGRAKEVRIGERRIAVFRIGDELHAIKNICPHHAEPLHCLPPVKGEAICIGHGWRFNLKSGACTAGHEDARVAVYPVRVEGDDVQVGV